MEKIKKALLFRILAVCLSICLFLDTIAYSAPVLRVNSIFDNMGYAGDEKRQKEMTVMAKLAEAGSDLENILQVVDVTDMYVDDKFHNSKVIMIVSDVEYELSRFGIEVSHDDAAAMVDKRLKIIHSDKNIPKKYIMSQEYIKIKDILRGAAIGLTMSIIVSLLTHQELVNLIFSYISVREFFLVILALPLSVFMIRDMYWIFRPVEKRKVEKFYKVAKDVSDKLRTGDLKNLHLSYLTTLSEIIISLPYNLASSSFLLVGIVASLAAPGIEGKMISFLGEFNPYYFISMYRIRDAAAVTGGLYRNRVLLHRNLSDDAMEDRTCAHEYGHVIGLSNDLCTAVGEFYSLQHHSLLDIGIYSPRDFSYREIGDKRFVK